MAGIYVVMSFFTGLCTWVVFTGSVLHCGHAVNTIIKEISTVKMIFSCLIK